LAGLNNWPNGNWYDAVYGDDPSTDNIFGREALGERRNPLLHACLARGGRLSEFSRRKAEAGLGAALDRAIMPALAQAGSARLWPDRDARAGHETE
jgi:hypothetical protein